MNKKEILAKIADNIRMERLRKKYSQQKLADLCGITQKYLNLIENQKVNPSIAIIVAICQSLYIDLNTLMS